MEASPAGPVRNVLSLDAPARGTTMDGDGHPSVFPGEMGSPGAGPQCKTRIFWGDGRGDFKEQVIAVGKANHESKLGDLDGDGKIDILGKPYSLETPLLHVWVQE